MRFRPIAASAGVLSLLALFCPCARAAKKTVTIASISPLHVKAQNKATVIVTGLHLDQVGGCSVQPVNAASSAAQLFDGCKARPNATGNQLIVTIDPSLIHDEGDYLLLLTETDVEPGAGSDHGATSFGKATLLAFGRIHVDSSGSSNTSSTPGNGSAGNSDLVKPYTDCLSEAPDSGGVSSLAVPPSGVICGSSVVPDSEVSDEFGYHVSNLYSAIQVRVSNKNSQYDFLLRDILLTLPDGRIVSGRIRRFAQGVAVKGKTHDRRSILFNSLTATGGVYGALASFGSAGFTAAGNVLQGAFMASFNQIFPDYTADNVNRFNNAVFDDQNPSIVPKDSIGQPPLYVIALVPKEPGFSKDLSYQSAKSIQVSIEGTFIKQVTLLSLSPTSLSFKPQFISPQAVFPKPAFNFDALIAASEEQQVTISNTGSTPMNIHGFTIVPTGSTTTGTSPDFTPDTSKSTCGLSGANSSASNGTTAFTVAPNSSCFVMVQFHPTTVGSITATLNVTGDNLEGGTTVTLTGTGIGLILQAQDSTAPNPPSHTMHCSASDTGCSFDIGVQTATPTPINVYYFSANQTTDTLAFTTASGGSAAPQTIKSSGSLPLAGGTAPSPSGQVSIPTPTTAASSQLSITDSPASAFKTGFPITVNYHSIVTTLTVSGVSSGNLDFTPPQANPTVTASKRSDGTPVAGSVSYVITPSGKPALATKMVSLDSTTGVGSLDFGGLAPGTYTVNATYPSNGQLSTSSSSFTLTVHPAVTTITIGPKPSGAALNTAVAIPVTVAGTPACTGTITSTVTTPSGATVTPTPSALTNGSATVTFTPTTAGSYGISVKYVPDAASYCAALTQSGPVSLP